MSKWSLAEHITTNMTRKRLGNIRPPALWPSEGSAVIKSKLNTDITTGACRRSTYFRYTADNYSFKPDPKYKDLVETLNSNKLPADKYMNWIWAAGNLFEDYVITQSKESGVYIQSQVQVVIPEINLVGKLDIIVIDPITMNLIGMEVKSVSGYGAKEVLGTEVSKRKGILGTPRDSNMIQAALYEWHLKKTIPNFTCRLVYGARDTGVFAEYEITTVEEHGQTNIYYQGVAPIETKKIKADITIDNILEQYKLINDAFVHGHIPERDYEIVYSKKHIKDLYEADLLSQTNKETYEKIQARIKENEELLAQGKKPKKELKELQLGEWRCERCQWRTVCYDENNQPKQVTL